MTPAGAEIRIRELMAEVLEVEPGSLGDGVRRDDVPSWDSLNHLRIVTALEEAFGIRFTMREVGQMETVAEVRRLVEARAGS